MLFKLHKSSKGTPTSGVRINFKSGLIFIGKTSREKLNTDYVLLYIDKENNRIGIKAATKEDPYRLKISTHPGNRSTMISGRGLINQYFSEYKGSIRIIPEWEDGMMVLQIPKKGK